MVVLPFVLAACGGYLLGSIPFGLLLTRWAGLGDIRAIGSGNIGATNVLRTGRKDIAAATLVLDALKAGVACVIARALWGGYDSGQVEVGLLAGAAAFIGHCYPVWLGFKGGKGVATYFGLLLFGMPPLGISIALVWVAVAAIFRYSSLASLTSVVVAIILAVIGQFSIAEIACLVLVGALIFWRHRANIQRLRAGTEPRIGAPKEAAPIAPVEPPAEAGP